MALLEYKCPCCSGKLEFDGSIGKVKCPFCDTEFDVDVFNQMDEGLEQETADNLDWKADSNAVWTADETVGMASYTCNSCGAHIVADETTAAAKCPYCDNPIVMTGNVAGDIKPEFIIPFKVDKKAAKEALKKHLEGKRLLPAVFKDQNHINDIQGVYVPYWVYDSDARASIRYRAERVSHRIEGDYDVTETEHYMVLRNGSMAFENITIDGSQKMDDALMDSVEPFDMSQAVDFKTAYMAGYLADKYDVDSEKCSERANMRVKNSVESTFAATVNDYTSVHCENVNVDLKNGRVRYGLLPLWILNTTWNGTKYTFAMNGQTGKFVGDLPCDKSLLNKYRLRTGVIFAAIAAVVTIVFQLL